MKNPKIKKIICLLTFMLTLSCTTLTAEAANTCFDVPSFGMEMDNLLYENDSQTIQATSWGYGTEANIINTMGIEAGIAELNSNVTPEGGRSTVSVYTNGAEISGAAMDAIAGAGWKRMAWYYYDYMVEGDATAGLGNQTPECGFTEDAAIKAELEKRGFDGRYEMASVSGWYANNAYVTLYTGKCAFSANSNFDVYKYEAETNSFTKLAKQGFYGANYFSIFNIQGDGIYVATSKPLTEEQMAPGESETADVTESSADTIFGEASVEESATEETEKSVNTNDSTEAGNETNEESATTILDDVKATEVAQNKANTVESSDGKIHWVFEDEANLMGFTPEAEIEHVGDNEVAVSFVFDGSLPTEAEVTITLPVGVFQEGTMLHLFYYKPEDGSRELVDSQICVENSVTFSMSHCSDYIITSVPPEETTGTGMLIAGIIGALALAGVVVIIVVIRKKRNLVE